MSKATIQIPTPTEEHKANFWAKVKVGTQTECWIWSGRKSHYGHGVFKLKGVSVQAHRFSFMLAGGITTEEKPWVLHSCPGGDNPACVNPAHLRAGTPTDNVYDKKRNGTFYLGDRHTYSTHPENIRRGERVNTARLKESDVIEMRMDFENGLTVAELSKKFQISLCPVQMILYGTSWSHVGGPIFKSLRDRTPQTKQGAADKKRQAILKGRRSQRAHRNARRNQP